MLAMDVNDDAGSLMPRGALESIASMLAPTGKWRAYPGSIAPALFWIRKHWCRREWNCWCGGGLVASITPNTTIRQRSGGARARAHQDVIPCFRPHAPSGDWRL